MLSKILTERYKLSRHASIKGWRLTSRCPISGQTANEVLGHGKKPSIPTFIIMAYYLDFPAHEISETLALYAKSIQCKEDDRAVAKTFHILIPSIKVNDPPDRQTMQIMEMVAPLAIEKKKLVVNLIKSLAG